MDIKNLRLQKLLQLFLNHHSLTGDETCQALNIAPRTLRLYLNALKPILLSYGAEITSSSSIGYELVLHDEERFYDFLERYMNDSLNDDHYYPILPSDRVEYILMRLINSDGCLYISELENELFVSTTTINNDLRKVKERIQNHSLKISGKTRKGIKLGGREFDKRLIMAAYCLESDAQCKKWLSEAYFNSKETACEIMAAEYDRENLKITQHGIHHAVIHLLIAMKRNNLQQEDLEQIQQFDLRQTAEYQIAARVLTRMQEIIPQEVDSAEQYYLAAHLLAKQNLLPNRRNEPAGFRLDEILNAILQRAQSQFGYDFSHDKELQNHLFNHLKPMLFRMVWGIRIENPLLEDIKSSSFLAYEIAKCAAKVIKETTGLNPEPAETGYLALHFWVALEKIKKITRFRLILVTTRGMGNIELVKYQLLEMFGSHIEQITVAQPYELNHINQFDYDLILTTESIDFETNIQVLHIQNFLSKEDIELLTHFFTSSNHRIIEQFFPGDFIFTDLKSKCQEDILKEMIKRVSKRITLPKDFFELLLKREKLSSTAYGNDTAVPHPIYPLDIPSFVALAILKEPVLWFDKPIRFIFLLNINKFEIKHMSFLTDAIAAIVLNQEYLERIEKDPEINTVQDIMNEYKMKLSDDRS